METQMKQMISEELKEFYCTILLDEMKETVRKLRIFGVRDDEIENVLHEDAFFPQLIVTEDYRLVLGSEKRIEIMMEPIVKAVYLLFLSHPEGIVLKCLPDYRAELTRFYLLLKPKGMTARVERSISDVTNPMLNSINEKCTKIRKIFSEILPKGIARHYSISGRRGEVKKIDLVRANVIWECKIPDSKIL